MTKEQAQRADQVERAVAFLGDAIKHLLSASASHEVVVEALREMQRRIEIGMHGVGP